MTDTVDVLLPYLKPIAQEPVSHAGYPDLENLVYDWRKVTVTDAGLIPGGATLRTHGFTTVRNEGALNAFEQSDQWFDAFAAEVERILKRLTGASEVVIPPGAATYRSASLQGSQGPASFCHNDFTSVGTAQHVARLDPGKAERRLTRRFGAYHAWRLVSPPPQDIPLALCDARSVRVADMIPGKAYYGGPDNTTLFGNMAMFSYNPAHRWFYFPNLGNDETIIWAGYDSDPEWQSIVPHTAFRDPSCNADAVPRANVECRCFVFFD